MKAVVFDMDGVLLDTERLMKKNWEKAAIECGFKEHKEASLKATGRNLNGVRQLFADEYPYVDFEAFHDKYSSYTQEFMKTYGVPVKDGVLEALQILKNKGYVLAVATSTTSKHALWQLESAGITPFMEVIFTGDSVINGKPHPEIYLKSCEAVQTEPEKCYGVEDSPNGLKSVFSAGMKSIYIPDVTQVSEEYNKYITEKYKTILDFANSVDYAE